jgi:hypothetical protein
LRLKLNAARYTLYAKHGKLPRGNCPALQLIPLIYRTQKRVSKTIKTRAFRLTFCQNDLTFYQFDPNLDHFSNTFSDENIFSPYPFYPEQAQHVEGLLHLAHIR